MRTRMVAKEELADRLLKKFGHNEPIFTSEIIKTWKEYSRPRVFQLLRELLKDGLITKSRPGVYFFPTQLRGGEWTIIGHHQILEKKFIRRGEERFGYYSGLKLLNGLHLITQMPFDLELISSKTSASVRKIQMGRATLTVHRSKVPITKDNVQTLKLLQAFTDIGQLPSRKQTAYLKEYVELYNIKEKDVLHYARYFPAYTLERLLETGMKNVFAQ